MIRPLPPGIWAIASGIKTETELDAWMEKAAWADAWTFRNPKFSERKTVAFLKSFQDKAPWLAVHSRLDWAMQAHADALILGTRSLPWEEISDTTQKMAMSTTPPGRIPRLGASVHDDREVARAVQVGAEFLVLGPIWETPSKEGILEPRGINRLAEICEAGLPVVAVGGIQSPEQAAACMDAGAYAVAVLRAYDRPELTQSR